MADEPTGSLDSNNAHNIMGVMTEFNEKLKATILMVTHDPMSASYCKRVIFLKDGNIINFVERKKNAQKDFYKIIVEYNSKLQQAN